MIAGLLFSPLTILCLCRPLAASNNPHPCGNLECGYGSSCIVARDGSSARCQCPERCPSYGDHTLSRPLCGSDGRSYANHCEMMREACILEINITIKHSGICKPDTLRDIPEIIQSRTANLIQNWIADRAASTSEIIATTTRATTTSSSSTTTTTTTTAMPTDSTLMTEELLPSTNNMMASTLEREVCKDIHCDYSATCELGPDDFPRCSCKFECTHDNDKSEPVCASDLRIYSSLCAMKMEACQRQVDLRLRPLDLCQGVAVKPCKGEAPLKDPITNKDLDCGHGAFRQDCPSGSYCHQTSSFARCCKKDNTIPQKHCSDSWFGCCPDGITFATNPDHTGCPSSCNCNKLGSYENTCDPITLQCRCKPGVGGLQCDRCEPGFWGLPKISTGHQGCIPCGCSPYGSVREDCEQMTGRCVCKPDIQGQKCTICTSHNKVLGPNGCTAEIISTGTDWPLRPYTSFQYTQSDDMNSPLSKSTRHLLYPDPREEYFSYNMIVPPEEQHQDELVKNELKSPLENIDLDTGWNYNIPYFDGQAHIRIKALKAYYKVNIEIEFKTNKPNGVLFYNGQHTDGTGDFLAIALINGYLEFRYNLGDGIVIITSPEKLLERCFHTIIARRYNQDGELKIDSGYTTAGHSRGKFKALDLKDDGYIGYILTNHSRVYDNIGTSYGFDGCIKKFKVHRKLIDLWIKKDESVIDTVGVQDCEQTPCSNIVCNNNNNITCILKDT